MLWIALYLPDLPLQALLRGCSRPACAAIVEQRPRQRLVSVCPAAWAAGVRCDTSVAGALSIAPEIVLLERDVDLEQAMLRKLAVWAGRFSPRVSLAGADTVLLEISSSLRLFGGLDALFSCIGNEAGGLDLQWQAATAPTPLAAHWLARSQNGVRVADAPGWSRCLDGLPVDVLLADAEVSPASLSVLEAVGIRRLGELDRLPRDALARRQSSPLLRTLARARGELPDPRPWFEPPRQFEARLNLPVPVSDTEPLLFACARLIADLVHWLDALHGAVERCRLALEHDQREATVLDIVTVGPDRDASRLQLILRERLAVLSLPATVTGLRLSADSPVARQGITSDLFGGQDPDPAAANLLLDRLRARLGADCVRGVQVWPDHRPEQASRTVTPGLRPATAGRPDEQSAQTASGRSPIRPYWLLDPPRPLPSLQGFLLRSGPERIESGWWDGSDVCRDYYIAQGPDQGLCWIFHDLSAPGHWFVHGYFG